MSTPVKKPAKLPAKIFVTSKKDVENEWYTDAFGNYQSREISVRRFGFLHPHDNTAADAKRKETQFSWAYDGTVYQVGSEWWHKGVDRPWQTRIPYDRPIDPEYAPCVYDNEPLTGFKIIDTVHRYRGNKLFKVEDPRGFDVEITVESLYKILMAGEINRGEIITPCIWKANKNLVIVE